MFEFLRIFENRVIKIARVNSIIITKSINLRLFTLILYGVEGPSWSNTIFHAKSIYREVYDKIDMKNETVQYKRIFGLKTKNIYIAYFGKSQLYKQVLFDFYHGPNEQPSKMIFLASKWVHFKNNNYTIINLLICSHGFLYVFPTCNIRID